MTDVNQSTILLACINCNQGSSRITALLNERREIVHLLESAEDQGVCRVIQEDVNEDTSFEAVLNKYAFVEPISILHIIGPMQDEVADPLANLSSILGKFPDLKMVFLNGCARLSVVEMLLLSGIPVVFATQTILPQPALTDISKIFFDSIGKGKNLQEAFEICQAQSPNPIGRFVGNYDFEADKLKWDNSTVSSQTSFMPWGIYQLEGQGELTWKMDVSPIKTVPTPSIEEPDLAKPEVENIQSDQPPVGNLKLAPVFKNEGFKKNLTYARLRTNVANIPKNALYAAAGILILACIGGWIGINALRSDYVSEVPSKGNHFRVVMLSVKHNDHCGQENYMYTGAILSQLKFLEQENDNIEVLHQEIPTCEPDERIAQDLLIARKADMVIWGFVNPQDDDSSNVDLRYQFASLEDYRDVQIGGGRKFTSPTHIYQHGNDRLVQEIDDAVFLSLGSYFFNQREYASAVKNFAQVIPTKGEEEDWYLKKMASSLNHVGRELIKQRKNELAWDAFNRALSYNPAFTEAYYNRGLLYMKQKKLNEAIEDMDKVITLQPSIGRANGILAAIYASRKDEALFYKNLELCLSKGTDISQYINFTAVKDYEQEPRFQALLAKYAK